MSGAGEALQQAAMSALAGVAGIGRAYDAPPLQAAIPYALVEADLEADWSHKTGIGKEVRLAVTLFDKGERPVRLRRAAAEAEAAIAPLGGDVGGWLLVSIRYLRTRIVAEPRIGWAAVIEFRARLLAAS